MNCPKCNAAIPDGSKFCNECGSNISAASKQSGAEPGARDLSLGNLPTMGAGAHAAAVSLDGQRTLAGAAKAQDPGQSGGVPLSDRYELLEELGRGGFAVVWKARDKKLDRVVAVKRLQVNMLQGHGAAQTLERFRREARAIASMNHRNIVAVFDCDRDRDGDYIVMEYIGGGSLRDHLKGNEGRLPVPEATRLARGIAEGLAYAHRKNLVHRDIKPANILLLPAENGELIPKILDFGLARMGGDSETSVSGYGLGTPYYMPPEQRRDAKNVNHTADIYALGKTLYEMVSGEIPDSVDPEMVPPPPELAQIIFKCVKAKSEERYFSADELVAALAAIMVGGPVATGTTTSGSTAANPCPACGRANLDDARFCEGCGTGLIGPCPECGRETQSRVKFCPGCGTDSAAFQTVTETQSRMERFQKECKWSRVIKEADLLPKGVRLPGEKGRAALGTVQTQREVAVTAQANKAKLKDTIVAAEAAGQWDKALVVLAEYAKLAPDESEMIAAHRQCCEDKKAAALVAARTVEFETLIESVRKALDQGTVETAVAHLAHARQVLNAVNQDVVSADVAEAELQELGANIAARQAELAAKDAAARGVRRRRLLGGAGAVCALTAIVVLGFWAINAMRFRADVRAFETEARTDQVERAMALAPRLRANYPPVAQWEHLQQERTEMNTTRHDADTAGTSTAAKTEWEMAEQEATSARESAAQGLYADAASRTRAARDGYQRALKRAPDGRYRMALAQGLKALDATDWKTAEDAFQRALSETTVKDRQAAEDGLKRSRIGFLVAAAGAARDEGLKALVAHDWPKAAEAFKTALAEPAFLDRTTADNGLKKARLGDFLAAATTAKEKGDWETVIARANDALQLDAINATAKQLLLEAQPVLTIRALADGKETAGAIITLNGVEQKERTPLRLAMKMGEACTIGVSLSDDSSEEYYVPFKVTYRVDHNGPHELKAILKNLLPTGFKAVKSKLSGTNTKAGWPREMIHEKTGIELVYIPAGTFYMGADELEYWALTEAGDGSLYTQHEVTLTKAFYMGKHKVTGRQWKTIMGGATSTFESAGHETSVESVSWNDGQAFCKKLGPGFRLPTEAEWEYACRAGRTPHVDEEKANAWGLYEMSVGELEWCQDNLRSYGYGSVTDPMVDGWMTDDRVARGGNSARVPSRRFGVKPNHGAGIRVVYCLSEQ